MSVLLVIWLFSTAAGQFILERGPSCSDGSLVYSCTRSDGFFLIWRFQPSGVRKGVGTGDSPQTVTVGSSMVLLTVLPASGDSFISATATIANSDSVRLNGTTISCGSDTLNISVPDVRKYLPIQLEVYQRANNTIIHPTPNIFEVVYNVTSANNINRYGVLNNSAIIIEESNVAINLSFICQEISIRYIIGNCIYQSYNNNLTYTLYSEENWKITCFNNSNEISNIMCMSDGNWSVPNPCIESTLLATAVSSTTLNDENTATNIFSSTTGSNNYSEENCTCGNLVAYLVAPMVALFFALVGNIFVMIICFTKLKKRNSEENLDNIKCSNTLSSKKRNNDCQEGCAVDLQDNVAYDFINTK